MTRSLSEKWKDQTSFVLEKDLQILDEWKKEKVKLSDEEKWK